MQRNKLDLSDQPKFGPMQKVISDVDNAPHDDPVFAVSQLSSEEQSNQDETLKSAVEFINTTRQMNDLMTQLEKNRDTLERNRERLASMAEHIKFQAAQALK